MTCGDDDAQMRFNFAAGGRLRHRARSGGPPTVEQSEILLRPLAPAAGGVATRAASSSSRARTQTWLQWEAWAEEVQANPLARRSKSAGQQFFEANVMPKLLQRGCALEGCHSPDGFNDFRLRSGAQGFFAPSALERNYDDAGRRVHGARHRRRQAVARGEEEHLRAAGRHDPPRRPGAGGRGRTPSTTPARSRSTPTTTTRAFCVLQAVAPDRSVRIARRPCRRWRPATCLPLAFVARPPNPDTLLQFDTYEGGADLKLADAALGAAGMVTSVAQRAQRR